MVLILFIFGLINYSNCFNIDIYSPIVYVDSSPPPAGNKSSYFGYTVALFPETRINPAGIYIGAPRASDPSVNFESPGAIFTCGTPGPCYMLTLDREPETISFGSIRYINKLDDAWIGGSMDINLDTQRFATCGYRWINVKRRHNLQDADYFMEGSCYWWHLYDNTTQKLVPLIQTEKEIYTDPYYHRSTYYYAQGLFGFSVHMPKLPKGSNEILFGAPGVFNWHGTSIRYSDSDTSSPVASRYRVGKNIEPSEFADLNVANAVHTTQVGQHHLLGYQSTSGHYYSRVKSNIFYVSSAPKGAKYQGQVLIYGFGRGNDMPLNVIESKQGTQFGEYFGGSLTSGDINNDGYDDLIVGAPFHVADKYNEGRIYVFVGSAKGRLQEPKTGKTIEGMQVNGQFGSTVQYLEDINGDGFGDVAVSAPYEEKNGVVYIYRGTKFGLDTTPVQRIIGREISPELRGFGISIAKPVDIDSNRHKDLAIGAHLSGHVVLLRTGPTVTIYHNLENGLPRIDVRQSQFNTSACFYFQMQEYIDMIEIDAIVTVDEKLNRATLQGRKNNRESFKIKLTANRTKCFDFTVFLRGDINNRYDPLTVSLDHKLITKVPKKEVIYIQNDRITGTDHFCVRCPFYNKYDSSQLTTLNIPFTLGCKLENVCKSALEFNVSLSYTSDNNTFILGSTNYLKIKIDVRNAGERAYLTQAVVSLPEVVNFRLIPSFCSELNSSAVSCAIDNPLEPNSEKSVTLELDMVNVNSGKYEGNSLDIAVNILTSSDNSNENFEIIRVDLKREADVTISGKSGEQSYSYGNVTHGMPNFTQLYQIEKFGISLVDEVQIEIDIPHKIETGAEIIEFLSLYPPVGNLAGQPITCSSNFSYLVEGKKLDDADSAIMSQEQEEEEEKAATRSRRDVQQVEIFDNATIAMMDKENLVANSEFNAAINRTFFINCSMTQVICSKIICKAGPFKSSNQIAAIQLKMLADMNKIKKLLGKSKDVIVLSTRGFVEILSPADFIQDGNRPDGAYVSTIFVGDTVDSKVETWIIILAVIAGLLLLLLLILGLIKAGFFKRKTKEELEQLKKEFEEDGGGENNDIVCLNHEESLQELDVTKE